MDDVGGLGTRNWAYYEPPLKGTLGLQLMSPVVEQDMKPLMSNGGFLHRDCGIPKPPIPMEFVHDGWVAHHDSRVLHMLPVSTAYAPAIFPDAPSAHNLQMLQPTPTTNKTPVVDEPSVRKDKATASKKSSVGRPAKLLKPKKPKKAAATREAHANNSVSRRRTGDRNTGMVINGIDLDISGIPTPVCSCTGNSQQCYRWGIGGWQSACCTTSISMYPLPMGTKRRGARIAGRKMSQGAFKKVLEKLAGEGYNLSNPIDLKTYWAKHGTNKFVTIR